MLYTSLKHLEKEIKLLVKLGVVDPSWLRNIKIMERYAELKAEDVCNLCAYHFIAEEQGISWSSVKKIVKRLSN
jgi:hypothetical protein